MPFDGSLTTTHPGFQITRDRQSVEAAIDRDLHRIFQTVKSPHPDAEGLCRIYKEVAMEGKWRAVSLSFDSRASAYYMPSLNGPPKAMIALFTGCESSPLTSAKRIKALQEQGIAFVHFGMVTHNTCPEETKRIKDNKALNAWAAFNPQSPLLQIHTHDRMPVTCLTESAQNQLIADNLLSEENASKMRAFFSHWHMAAPYFDSANASASYPEGQGRLGNLGKFLIRRPCSTAFGLYANINGSTMLGDGIFDQIVMKEIPLTRNATRKEGRILALSGRAISRQYAQLQKETPDHPVFSTAKTAWVATLDKASCPDAGIQAARHLGTAEENIHQIRSGHNILPRILPKIGAQVLEHAGN